MTAELIDRPNGLEATVNPHICPNTECEETAIRIGRRDTTGRPTFCERQNPHPTA
ncbi:hypothetical protein [Alloprevotella sp. OH1205_COT-284]|uniref:hypothetical protein n=1 Tax=Alloprevotella sp. OH1205_COT-284 TaxID=2491043 RepID=UPI0013150EE2|nr:hypothetical protein [Alloprevotella sp. OH1205_COT-284]